MQWHIRTNYHHDGTVSYQARGRYTHSSQANDILTWCNEKFGPADSFSKKGWHTSIDGYSCFYFSKEADRTLFLLRWS